MVQAALTILALRTKTRSRGADLPPGPGAPAAVQAIQWGFCPVRYLFRARRNFGDTFTMSLGPANRIVNFSHPEAIREVFKAEPNLLRGGAANQMLEPVFGRNSLLLLDEDEHRHHRRLIVPAFHGSDLELYVEDIRNIAHRRVDSWHPAQRRDLLAEAQAISLASILRVIFGSDDDDRSKLFAIRLAALNPNLFRAFAFLSGWLPLLGSQDPRVKFARARRSLKDLVDSYLEEGMERSDRGVLQQLIVARGNSGGELARDAVCDELITLLISGHESPAFSLSWSFEFLLRNPGAMCRAVDAARRSDGAYLTALIQESLRIRPILPMAVRRLSAAATIGRVDLPANTIVAANIFLAHTAAESFNDPLTFKPERFLADPPMRYTWLPFGGGPRRCAGAGFALLEMRLILEAILGRATLAPVEKSAARVHKRGFSFTPKGGVPVFVTQVRPRS